MPPPELDRLDFAEESLAEQLRRIANTVPYPPEPRFPDGQVDFLARTVNRDTMIADHDEGTQRFAVERLAEAAEVSES